VVLVAVMGRGRDLDPQHEGSSMLAAEARLPSTSAWLKVRMRRQKMREMRPHEGQDTRGTYKRVSVEELGAGEQLRCCPRLHRSLETSFAIQNQARPQRLAGQELAQPRKTMGASVS